MQDASEITNEIAVVEEKPHQITLLRGKVRVRKQRVAQPDGSVKKMPAESGKHWDVLQVPGDTLDDLQAALTSKENAIFVHGAPAPGLKAKGVLKNHETILEQPNPFMLFDVDGLPVPDLEPAKAAEYVRDTFLAREFHGTDCFFAATAGHGDEGLARMRLGFMTSRKINRDESRAWALRCPAPAKKLDLSIYTPSQPVFIGLDFVGCDDPFKSRTGRVAGAPRVTVPDDLHADAAKVHARAKTVAPGAIPDAPHMVEKFCASLYRRDGAAFESVGSRHVMLQNIAKDAGDLFVTEETCDAIVQCLFAADDDSQADLESWLRDLYVPNPVAVAGQVRRAGEAIADEWTGGVGAMDAPDVAEEIAEGYRYRSSPLGCTFAERDDGEDFAAIDLDEDDAEAHTALDLWLAEPSDLGRYEALVGDMTSRGVKRSAASRAVRDAQLGALLGVDEEAGVVALRELATAPREKTATNRFVPVSIEDAVTRARTVETPYLIKGLINEEGSSLLFGATNVGKTFVEIDLGFHIAAGISWNGHRVKQGAVLYIAAEGGRITYDRLDALSRKHNVKGVPFYIVTATPDLAHGVKDRDALTALVQDFERTHGVKIKLVIVDTVAMALAGADESTNEGMGALINAGNHLRLTTGVHVGYVHHSGKDTAKGARGHSSLKAAVDCELEIAENALTVTKLRDGPSGRLYPFALQTVELRTDGDGDKVFSCTVEWSDAKPSAVEPDQLNASEAAYMNAVDEVAKGLEAGATIPHESVMAVLNARRKADGKPAIAKNNGNRLRKGIAAKGHIACDAADEITVLWRPSKVSTDFAPVVEESE